jgi:hypothetical protein
MLNGRWLAGGWLAVFGIGDFGILLRRARPELGTSLPVRALFIGWAVALGWLILQLMVR